MTGEIAHTKWKCCCVACGRLRFAGARRRSRPRVNGHRWDPPSQDVRVHSVALLKVTRSTRCRPPRARPASPSSASPATRRKCVSRHSARPTSSRYRACALHAAVVVWLVVMCAYECNNVSGVHTRRAEFRKLYHPVSKVHLDDALAIRFPQPRRFVCTCCLQGCNTIRLALMNGVVL